MLDRILGKDIAIYVKAHRGLILLAIILSAMSSLFILIPVYLLKPLVDEGMNRANDPINWTIPWLIYHFPLTFKKTELTIIEGITPNRLLILLASIAFIAVILKSITRYSSELT